MNMCYIYSVARGGWMSRSGGFTSNLKDADLLPEDDAIARCKRFHEHYSGLSAVPVPVNLIKRVLEN